MQLISALPPFPALPPSGEPERGQGGSCARARAGRRHTAHLGRGRQAGSSTTASAAGRGGACRDTAGVGMKCERGVALLLRLQAAGVPAETLQVWG